MNENFIEKPEGKPVKAFRARVKMYDIIAVHLHSGSKSLHRFSLRLLYKILVHFFQFFNFQFFTFD